MAAAAAPLATTGDDDDDGGEYDFCHALTTPLDTTDDATDPPTLLPAPREVAVMPPINPHVVFAATTAPAAAPDEEHVTA